MRGPGLPKCAQWAQLALEIEGHCARDGRRLTVRAAVLAGRDVAQVVLEDPNASHGRRQPDHTRSVNLVGRDGPNLLAELNLLLLRYAKSLAEILVDLLQWCHLCRRLLAALPVGLEPVGVERPVAAGVVEREDVAREREEVL